MADNVNKTIDPEDTVELNVDDVKNGSYEAQRDAMEKRWAEFAANYRNKYGNDEKRMKDLVTIGGFFSDFMSEAMRTKNFDHARGNGGIGGSIRVKLLGLTNIDSVDEKELYKVFGFEDNLKKTS